MSQGSKIAGYVLSVCTDGIRMSVVAITKLGAIAAREWARRYPDDVQYFLIDSLPAESWPPTSESESITM
jgi:hypothetical protein